MSNVTPTKIVNHVCRFTLLFFLLSVVFCPVFALAQPVANAGNDQEVVSDQTVFLDATGSTGSIISYEWLQTSGPDVNLGQQAYIAEPNFMAPTVAEMTELEFYLTVMNSMEQTDSDSVSIWVFPPQNGGPGPEADAGPDQFCNEGDTVTLDGTGSSGTDITYAWSRTVGSDVTLDLSIPAQPSFVAPQTGGEMSLLTFQLTVTDSGEATDTDSVNVNVFPADVTIETTPAGDPLGILVDVASILDRYIITTTDAYSSTVTTQGTAPIDLPHGLADIRIHSQSPVITGTDTYTSTIAFYLPTAAPTGYGWGKLSLTDGWIDFSEHAVFNPARTVVTVTLTDGGDGDDNPVVGIIDDPSGLALFSGDDDDDDGDGDGGNCFIMTCLPR